MNLKTYIKRQTLKNRINNRLFFLITIILSGFYLLLPLPVFANEYEEYRPVTETAQENSFATLQSLNPDVIGWLSIHGTQIDYPFLQAQDNRKYLDRNATGEYAVTGSIFLDYRCNPNFNDFNTIIYGHYTPSGVMFGEIMKFADADFFESHKYGSIYYKGQEKGLEIFGILEVDAYDTNIYRMDVKNDEDKHAYYQYLMSKAKYKRDVSISPSDKMVLLSTCFIDVTNGRHILLAKITDELPPASQTVTTGSGQGMPTFLRYLEVIPVWVLYLTILVLFIIVIILTGFILVLWRKERTR